MFPTRTLALIVALTLSTSVPLVACAQEAPAPEAQQSCMVYAPNGVDTIPTVPGTPEWDRCVGAAAMYGEDAEGERDAERQAAQLIADRIDSGQHLYEDWTWVGMPPVVGAFNDALLDQWEAAGRPDASGWLESYAATMEV